MNHATIQRLATLLKELEPGFLPYPIFEQVARLVALPIIEFVPVRTTATGATEVLLIERDHNDPLWPGLLHTPGTVIRATDVQTGKQANWPAFTRILNDELMATAVSTPHYVGSIFHQSKRGAEQAQLYWVEVVEEPRVGTFWSIEQLPKTLMESQRKFITAAVTHYRAHLKRSS